MERGLYALFLKKLDELGKKDKLISFKDIYQKICPAFCITKPQCLDILLILKDFNIIEFIPYKGVKIKDEDFFKKQEKILKVRAENLPLTCTNQCEKCNKVFEAKITIQDTCPECSKEFAERIKKKQEQLKRENPNLAEWINLFQAIGDEMKEMHLLKAKEEADKK